MPPKKSGSIADWAKKSAEAAAVKSAKSAHYATQEREKKEGLVTLCRDIF
jgi:hypothetical protein